MTARKPNGTIELKELPVGRPLDYPKGIKGIDLGN